MPSIFDVLQFDHFGIGKVQSVDEMCVVPLIGKNRDMIADPSNLKFKSTSDYGSMVFENEDRNKPAIVPAHLMIRGDNAQDHAMSCSGVIEALESNTFKNACCIEETQAGYLSNSNNEEDILPIELRRVLLPYKERLKYKYNKLWSAIKEWMKDIEGIQNHYAHLRYFYDNENTKQELEQFTAEFEPVDDQIGAVILFGGVPVGLEIMPTENHWNAYWKQLIRGCYGAELIKLKKIKGTPSTLILPDIPNEAQVEQVQLILEDFTKQLNTAIIPLLKNIIISSSSNISSIGGLNTRLLYTSTGGGGDVILSGNEPIYVSLVI